jgi:hypothetical protein
MSVFCSFLFLRYSHEPFARDWLQTSIFPISASGVARITGMGHQHPDCSFLLKVEYYVVV